MFLSALIDYTSLQAKQSPLHLVDDTTNYVVTNADSSIYVAIRKRDAFPRTFCHQLDDGSFELGYDQAPESLLIQINQQGNTRVVRDTLATLPIFYGRSKGIFAMSNLYNEVARALPHITVSDHDVMMALVPRSQSSRSTLLQEVSQLLEREVLMSTSQQQHRETPQSRPWQNSSEATPTNPEDFLPVFTKHLEQFVTSRLDGQNVAFQVSGGLDSATLPLFIAHEHPNQRYLMRGLLPPGQAGQIQADKLRALELATSYQLELEQIHLRDDFYLTKVASLSNKTPIYYREVFNAPALDRDADELQKQGITVLVTGVGGDDLFENLTDIQTRFGFGEGEQAARQNATLPDYFTETFRTQYIASTPKQISQALPYQALSTMRATAAVNNRYIERNIWPVTPFIDPDLYTFVQGLPAHFRANKNILRAYHQAYNFPPEIYNAEKIEDFLEVLLVGIVSNPAIKILSAQLIENSIAVAKGYIDAAKLQSALNDANDIDMALALQYWLMTERSLQIYSHLVI